MAAAQAADAAAHAALAEFEARTARVASGAGASTSIASQEAGAPPGPSAHNKRGAAVHGNGGRKHVSVVHVACTLIMLQHDVAC